MKSSILNLKKTTKLMVRILFQMFSKHSGDKFSSKINIIACVDMFDFFVLYIALETLMGSKGDKREVAAEFPFSGLLLLL